MTYNFKHFLIWLVYWSPRVFVLSEILPTVQLYSIWSGSGSEFQQACSIFCWWQLLLIEKSTSMLPKSFKMVQNTKPHKVQMQNLDWKWISPLSRNIKKGDSCCVFAFMWIDTFHTIKPSTCSWEHLFVVSVSIQALETDMLVSQQRQTFWLLSIFCYSSHKHCDSSAGRSLQP